MAAFARLLNADDLGALQPIDKAYAKQRALVPAVTRASLHLYQRSGHSFVAYAEPGAPEVAGFLLAQATWSGDSAAVNVQRLALAHDDDLAAATALVKALSKSAYDAGVYHLEVSLPAGDVTARSALAAEGFVLLPSVVYARGLGSKAAQVEMAAGAGRTIETRTSGGEHA